MHVIRLETLAYLRVDFCRSFSILLDCNLKEARWQKAFSLRTWMDLVHVVVSIDWYSNILVGLKKSDEIIFSRPRIPATLFILVGLPVAGCGWVTNYPGLDCSKHHRLKPHATWRSNISYHYSFRGWYSQVLSLTHLTQLTFAFCEHTLRRKGRGKRKIPGPTHFWNMSHVLS